MFKDIFLFELWYRLQRPASYIYFAINILLGLLLGSIMLGVFGPELSGTMNGGGQGYTNSPFNVHTFLTAFGQFPGTFFIAAMMGLPVYRDFSRKAHSLFFTTPVSKNAYLGGRFLGSMLITIVIMFGIVIGFLLAHLIPAEEPPRLGAFDLWNFLNPFFINVLPYTIITGTIFFASVSLTRNQLFIYLNAIIILVLFGIVSSFATKIDNPIVASILDPTGSISFLKDTEYWTVFEKNNLVAPLSANVIAYLVVWFSIAGAILFFCLSNFRLSNASVNLIRTQPKIMERSMTTGDVASLMKVRLPKVNQVFNQKLNFEMLGLLFKREVNLIFSSIIFWILLVLGLAMAALTLALSPALNMWGTSTLPVTYQMIELLKSGYLPLFIYVLLTFYIGESIWRERTVGIKALFDVQPVSNWIFLTSKFLAILLIPIVALSFGILTGIIVQLTRGYFNIELGLYLQSILGHRMINFIFYIILCMLIQVLVNNKYLGMGMCVIALGLLVFLPPIVGIRDNLYIFMASSPLVYSDMNGFGHMLTPFLIFKTYWGALALFFLILAYGMYQRGNDYNILTRLKVLNRNSSMAYKGAAIGALVLFFAFGAFIYYNTHVLNEYTSRKETQKSQIEFEKKYKQYEGRLQPRITKVYLETDIYPERRDVDMRGKFMMINKTNDPIDTLYIMAGIGDYEYTKLEVDKPYEVLIEDEDYAWYSYKLENSLLPQDSLQLDFELNFTSKGFTNGIGNIQVLENGTFLNSQVLPSLGYNPMFELNDEGVRKKYGLAKRERRVPSINDTVAVKNTLISRDADWIDFESIVSTSSDQIAMTPGYLQKEWEENGRRYFHYKMDSKMLHFFNIVSGKYEVKRDVWEAPDGREIKLEIYHHPSHTYNLDRMMKSMKASLAYFSREFSPYQHQQLRILEFPRYMGFAQSFANTVPFSEAIGFIADVDEGDVDYPTYVTAHEIAHQWWAHQVIGGNVQGFNFLSETMSQYGAMMVMEELSGPTEMKKYLKEEMQSYLKGRSNESRREMPALLSENQQYIHYNKGSVIMYTLKDYIGADSINAAMRRYINDVAFQESPYTTTKEWLTYIEEVTPDSLQYLLTDLFETITLYDNECQEATYEKVEDRYKVKFKVSSRKLRDDGSGKESEIAINDYIDIGITGRNKVDGKWKDTMLYLQKHLINQDTLEFEFWVDQEPREAGIDPLNKLIDRAPNDNSKRVEEKTSETE